MGCDYSGRCMMYSTQDVTCIRMTHTCPIYKLAKAFEALDEKDKPPFIERSRLELYFEIKDGRLESKTFFKL